MPANESAGHSSFLALEGLHVFITGAAGGIGGAAVKEFLDQGCRVSALDRRPIDTSSLVSTPETLSRLQALDGDLTSESSLISAFSHATSHFGTPPNILIANAGITDESAHPPIWDLDTSTWDRVNSVNVRGTFLTIKHFLLSAKKHQEVHQTQLENLAIVVTGSETGKFGQEGHAEYASGKAGLQYGLVRTVKNEIVRLNDKARINAVAPGWVNTPLIGDRLDDPRDLWAENHATYVLLDCVWCDMPKRCAVGRGYSTLSIGAFSGFHLADQRNWMILASR